MSALGFIQGAGAALSGYNTAAAQKAAEDARIEQQKADMEQRSQQLYLQQQAQDNQKAESAADLAQRQKESTDRQTDLTDAANKAQALQLLEAGPKVGDAYVGASPDVQEAAANQYNAVGAGNPLFRPMLVPNALTGGVKLTPTATVAPGAGAALLAPPPAPDALMQPPAPQLTPPPPAASPMLTGGNPMPWDASANGQLTPPQLSPGLQPPPLVPTQSGPNDMVALRNPLFAPSISAQGDMAQIARTRALTPGTPEYAAAAAPLIRQQNIENDLNARKVTDEERAHADAVKQHAADVAKEESDSGDERNSRMDIVKYTAGAEMARLKSTQDFEKALAGIRSSGATAKVQSADLKKQYDAAAAAQTKVGSDATALRATMAQKIDDKGNAFNLLPDKKTIDPNDPDFKLMQAKIASRQADWQFYENQKNQINQQLHPTATQLRPPGAAQSVKTPMGRTISVQ